MKKFLRYAFRALKVLLIVLVVVYLAAWIYISVNKKQFIADVTEQIGEKINGDVQLRDADITFFKSFPRLAINIQDITVSDTMYSRHGHMFLQAKDLFLNVSIFKLIVRKPALNSLRIRNGSIFLYTDSTGYTNTYLMQSKKDPAGGPKKTKKNISLDDVRLQQFHITLLDERKEKYHDFLVKNMQVDLTDDGDKLLLENDVDIMVRSLAFNVPRGTFLKDASFTGEYILEYGKTSQVLSFKNITVNLSGQPYQLTGSFDLGEKNPGFTLKVIGNEVNYEEVKKLLPDRIAKSLAMVSLDKPLDAIADLHGPLRGGEPYIIANWTVKDATMKTIFMDFTHASFTGYYKNEVVKGLPRKDPNSVISISDFTADWHGLKVASNNIHILDLKNPILTCDMRSAFPLTALNNLVQAQSLKFSAGNADVVLAYKGPVEYTSLTNSYLNGHINFSNGKILYNPRNVALEDVNGALQFSNANLDINNVRCSVLGNRIVMNGTAKNILTLINSAPNDVNVYYKIYSPALNLASFTYLLKNRKPVTTTKASSSNLNTLSARLDDVLDKSRIEVDLVADKLYYKNFTGTNLNAGVTILQDRYVLNNVNMNLAGGSMALKGSLVSAAANRHNAALTADINTVDVHQLFSTFNNFGQDGVTAANLRGVLTANTDVKMSLDDEGQVLPSTSTGDVKFSLKKGALVNFEPIKRMKNFLIKNRDFDNVEFAELKNTFKVQNGDIVIPRMEIQSTVLTLFVEGKYSQKGESDMSIQIPLSNLKKRDEDYKPENIGVDKKGGRSIYLRGQTGDDGDIKFKLDLFKRYQKEHEKK